MFATLNSIATVIGYGAILYGLAKLWQDHQQTGWNETKHQIQRDNIERNLRFKETHPQEWATAESMWEGRRSRNENRRAEIARLESEMEEERGF